VPGTDPAVVPGVVLGGTGGIVSGPSVGTGGALVPTGNDPVIPGGGRPWSFVQPAAIAPVAIAAANANAARNRLRAGRGIHEVCQTATPASELSEVRCIGRRERMRT